MLIKRRTKEQRSLARAGTPRGHQDPNPAALLWPNSGTEGGCPTAWGHRGAGCCPVQSPSAVGCSDGGLRVGEFSPSCPKSNALRLEAKGRPDAALLRAEGGRGAPSSCSTGVVLDAGGAKELMHGACEDAGMQQSPARARGAPPALPRCSVLFSVPEERRRCVGSAQESCRRGKLYGCS